MKRVFVVEDHLIMRQVLSMLVQRMPSLELCGEAESAETALQAIPTSSPDIVLIDVSLPGMNGIELAGHIRAGQPNLPILFISGHDESVYAEQAYQVGAQGYTMKGDPMAIMTAVQDVLQGKLYFKTLPKAVRSTKN
jgi:DNA-binding NarL/FixJ family response regulator